MRFRPKHTQPMTVGIMINQSFQLGKDIFLLSLPSNILIVILISSFTFFFYLYAEHVGVEPLTFNTINIFNNLLLISITTAYVFNLLLQNNKQSYLKVIKKSLLETLKIMPTIIIATFLYAVSVSIGLILLVIPGLLLFAFFGLYTQVIVIENKGVIASLTRSWKIVKDSFLKVFACLFSIIIMTNLIIILLSILGKKFFQPDHYLSNVFIDLMTYIFIAPFIGSLFALLYFNSRANQEAFDHVTLKQELNF